MYPLNLSVKPGAWRLFTARKLDPAFAAFCKRIWERDFYTCQFCGFQAREFQEVVNLDQNYSRNILNNMATACCFCTQCFFLEAVGLNDYGGGTLIYLPEISQSDLNAFCHVLFCAMSNATAYQASAQSIYRSLKFRAQQVEEQFGSGCSKPANFGQMVLESTKTNDKIVSDILSSLRLLPSHAKFRAQIEAWAAAALSELPNTD